MKTMTKIVASAFTAAAIFIGSNVNAQTTPANKLRFGVGLELGAPTGVAHDRSNFELGGTARLQYGVSNNVALTLTSGYYNMFGKNVTVGGVTGKADDLGIIPVKAGVKGFLSDNFYLGAEAGAGFEVTGSGGLYGTDNKTKFLYSPTIGFANKTWDIGARYEGFTGSKGSSFGLVGLRIAYGFPL